ncbi:MAG: DUF3078 domain-containing protein [Chitinophagales bacterium]
MKNLYLTFVGIFIVAMLSAQPTDKLASGKADKKVAAEKPEGWTHGGTGSLTFNQVGLKNWSAGGDPSISFLLAAGYNADMKKGKHIWQNRLSTEFGIQKIKGQSFRKNADNLELFSKYGFQIDENEKWYFATLLNFRSQFSETFTFDGDGNKTGTISKFASPAILEYSIGIDYVPNDKFSLYMSPIAAKWIFVADDAIAALNLHGNQGENVNTQVGALAVAAYKHQVHENVTLGSTLKLYKDYLAGPAQNIDVDWQTNIGLKVTKFISASVFMHLIWDYDVDTNSEVAGMQRNLQFKDVIGVGFSYSFQAKPKGDKTPVE